MPLRFLPRKRYWLFDNLKRNEPSKDWSLYLIEYLGVSGSSSELLEVFTSFTELLGLAESYSEFLGVPWSSKELLRPPWSFLGSLKDPQSSLEFFELVRALQSSMELFRVPWSSWELLGPPWNSSLSLWGALGLNHLELCSIGDFYRKLVKFVLWVFKELPYTDMSNQNH